MIRRTRNIVAKFENGTIVIEPNTKDSPYRIQIPSELGYSKLELEQTDDTLYTLSEEGKSIGQVWYSILENIEVMIGSSYRNPVGILCVLFDKNKFTETDLDRIEEFMKCAGIGIGADFAASAMFPSVLDFEFEWNIEFKTKSWLPIDPTEDDPEWIDPIECTEFLLVDLEKKSNRTVLKIHSTPPGVKELKAN